MIGSQRIAGGLFRARLINPICKPSSRRASLSYAIAASRRISRRSLLRSPEEPSVGRLVAEHQPDAVAVRHAAFLTKYVVHRGGIGCPRPVPEWIRKLGGEDGKVVFASVFLGADGAR